MIYDEFHNFIVLHIFCSFESKCIVNYTIILIDTIYMLFRKLILPLLSKLYYISIFNDSFLESLLSKT